MKKEIRKMQPQEKPVTRKAPAAICLALLCAVLCASCAPKQESGSNAQNAAVSENTDAGQDAAAPGNADENQKAAAPGNADESQKAAAPGNEAAGQEAVTSEKAAAVQAGATQDPASEEAEADAEETMSEGTDTPCEVRSTQYTGSFSSMFLSEGDTVAVISPSSLPSRKQVDAVVNGLKEWGYIPVEGKHVCEETRTLDDCKEDLLWALEDPSVKAVFCVRGGYASSEVMDDMALDSISSAGKLIIGYSDITVYHSAWTMAGIPSVHASMSAAFMDLPAPCRDAEQKMLRGELPAYTCPSTPLCRTGETEGILIGGNLSTFTSVIGTEYDSTKTDQPYILFLEDESENLQHIHRYLTILKHHGVLDRAAGIVFGEWADIPTDLADYDGNSRGGTFTSVSDMISRQFLDGLDIPVAFGFPAGHADTNYPLLMGEKAHLKVSEDSFTLDWEE